MIINVIPDWNDKGLTEDTTGADVEMRFNILATMGPGESGRDLELLEARAALLEQSPLFFGNLVRKEIGIPERLARTAYAATVRYALPDKGDRPEGDDSGWGWSFDTTGGTSHVTQSIATIGNYGPGGRPAPDYRGAIGVSSDSVEGVDVVTPNLSFTISRNFPAIVPSQFLVMLAKFTGKVNATPFYGFAPGEVLFNGAGGSQSGIEPWNIQYKFTVSPNAENLTIGNIVVPFKRGWDYLWVRYADQMDTDSTSKVIKQPISAHLVQVYHYVSFTGLGV